MSSTLGEFTTFFACDAPIVIPACAAISIPPFGFVELPVVFAPETAGVSSGELRIESDDPARPVIVVPVLGRSGPAVGITATGPDE